MKYYFNNTNRSNNVPRMSRRPIFLLAATVLVLYFSIIVFILSPLHGAKGVYYNNNYMNHFGLRPAPSVVWCKELRWRSPPSPNTAALVSHPGSGNTWLRYLLQQATGLVTGSIYMDYGLRVHGFPAENVTDGSVLVVKTHEAPPLQPDKFKAAILLIRNPRDAILADFNRLHKGHIGTAPKSVFKKRTAEENDWGLYVKIQLRAWENLHELWLSKFQGPMYIVFYKALVKDTENTLRGILNFLNYTITEDDMRCTLLNKEGIYRRKKKYDNFDPFTQDMYRRLRLVKERVLKSIKKYRKKTVSSNVTIDMF